MMINKIFIVSIIVLITLVNIGLSGAEADICDYTDENIMYLISPLGRSEYKNHGAVDLKGIKVNLVTLKSKVLMVEQSEKIYSDPTSLLPYRIERTISKLWGKEYITEEYDQKNFTVVIKRFKGKKLIKERTIKADGPIQNVVLFLFYLRGNPDLKIGWNFTARVPAELKLELTSIKLELVSIDQISVPAGKFQAYHFKSIPATFEMWINKNVPQVPIKIKVKSIIDCSVVMSRYSSRKQ